MDDERTLALQLDADLALMALDGWGVFVDAEVDVPARPVSEARWQWATPEPPHTRRAASLRRSPQAIYEQPGMAVIA